LKLRGWKKARVWVGDDIQRRTNETFDGWKCFSSEEGDRFGVAVEIEWNWERVYFDLLKLWRGVEDWAWDRGLARPDSFR
jgi:hypothetical protein